MPTKGQKMHHETLQRLLDLIGKTGDRVVVTDPAGDKPYVLMSLDQYEKLMGSEAPAEKPAPAPVTASRPSRRPSLQVAEDLDPPVDLSQSRKKREIPLWKPADEPKPAPEAEDVQESPNETESEEQFYLEPLE